MVLAIGLHAAFLRRLFSVGGLGLPIALACATASRRRAIMR
jgi:hypothetical protein